MPPSKKKKGLPKLRGNLLLKYSASVFELQAAQAKLETIEARIKNKAEREPVFAEALSMLSMRNQLEVDKSKAISKVTNVAKKVCEKLDIAMEKFKDYTVDTETGAVMYVPVKETPTKENQNG